MSIRRLNHAVLYVRDANRSKRFYTEVLGFRERANIGEQAYFLQADGSDNDHDLGLFEVGDSPRSAPHRPGLYHLAWQVHTLEELAALRARLVEVGSLVGESDHGVSKSLYAKDPDGLEFEVMWLVPPELWGDEEHEAIIRPLNIDAERRRFTAVGPQST